MTTRKFAIIAAVLALALAAGCFRDVKCVRKVESERRAQSLDVRTADPTERMYSGRPDARPVHEETGPIDLSRPLTLGRAIEIALDAHPEIRRMQAKIDGAAARTRELETKGWAEFLADITYAPDAKMFLDEPLVSSGDRLRNNVARFNVALRQPVYFEWQRRRALLNANNEEISRLQVEMEMKKNEVVSEVCLAFLELTKARRQCDYRRGVYHLDQKRLVLVGKLVDRGILLSASRHKAAGFMEAARRDCAAAGVVLASKERKLKNILGIDSRLPADVVAVEFKEIPLIPFEQAQDYLTARSMEFGALDHAVEKARWDKEAMRWEDIDLDFYVRYGYDLEDWSKGTDDFLILSLALRYPLMHIKARNARVVQGLKRMEEFEIEREVQQQRLLNDLETVYSKVEEHRADMNSFLAAIDEARENLHMAQIFEKKGTADESLKADPENILLSIISAIAILNARFKYEEARLDYLGAIMEQYRLLDRASELAEFAREYDHDREYAAQSMAILVNDTQRLLESPDEQTQLLEICRGEGISSLYLRVEPADFRLNSLTGFIALAHSQKLRVLAVMGDDEWLAAGALQEAESAAVTEFFDLGERCKPLSPEADEEDRAHGKGGKFFDGLHIDFGGARLADWAAWPEGKKERLRRMLAAARKRCDDGRISLGFSVNGNKPDRELYDTLGRNCDDLCIYFGANKESDLVAAAGPLLPIFDPTGVRVRVALQTAGDLPPEQTYYRKGRYMMWGETAEIAEKLGLYPTFGGILIDDFHGLLAIEKEK